MSENIGAQVKRCVAIPKESNPLEVEKALLTAVKRVCMSNNENIPHVFHYLTQELVNRKALVRIRAFLVIDYVLHRSKVFRDLCFLNIKYLVECMNLLAEQSNEQPKPYFAELEAKGKEFLELWDHLYGPKYPQICAIVRYLKESKRLKMPNIMVRYELYKPHELYSIIPPLFIQQKAAEVAQNKKESQEREHKKLQLQAKRVLEEEWSGTMREYCVIVQEVHQCFELLFPSLGADESELDGHHNKDISAHNKDGNIKYTFQRNDEKGGEEGKEREVGLSEANNQLTSEEDVKWEDEEEGGEVGGEGGGEEGEGGGEVNSVKDYMHPSSRPLYIPSQPSSHSHPTSTPPLSPSFSTSQTHNPETSNFIQNMFRNQEGEVLPEDEIGGGVPYTLSINLSTSARDLETKENAIIIQQIRENCKYLVKIAVPRLLEWRVLLQTLLVEERREQGDGGGREEEGGKDGRGEGGEDGERHPSYYSSSVLGKRVSECQDLPAVTGDVKNEKQHHHHQIREKLAHLNLLLEEMKVLLTGKCKELLRDEVLVS